MPIIHSLLFTDAHKEIVDAVFPYDVALPFDQELIPDRMALTDFLIESGMLCCDSRTFHDDIDVLTQRVYRASPDDSVTAILRWHEYGDESQAILGSFTRLREGYANPHAFDPQDASVMALA